MNSYLKNLNKVLIASVFLFFVALLIFSFGRNYGVHEDEGALLYYLSQGYSETTFSTFHILPNLIGQLFNHSILGYRVLNLVLFLLCAYYATCRTRYFINGDNKSPRADLIYNFLFITLFTFFFYSYIPTVSYNSTITLAIFLWVGSFCSIINPQSSYKGNKLDLLLFSLSIFMALSSRMSFGIALILFTLLVSTLLYAKYRNEIPTNFKVFAFSLLASVLVYVAVSFDNLIYISKVSSDFASSSHANLLDSYLDFFSKYFDKIFPLKIFVASILIFIANFILQPHTTEQRSKILSLHRGIKYLSITIIIFLAFKKIIKELGEFYVVTGAPSSMSSQILLNMFSLLLIFNFLYILYQIIIYIRFNKSEVKDRALKKLTLASLVVFAVLASPIGTNSNIIVFSALSMGPFALPFVNFFRNSDFEFKFKHLVGLILIFFISSSLLIIVYKEQVFHYRRNAEYKHQTHKAISSSRLKNVLIEKEIANNIDNISLHLGEMGFNYKSDRLIAYPDMPGYIAATENAKTYGAAWLFWTSDLKEMNNIDIRNCAELNNETDGEAKRIYLILGGEFSPGFAECFNKKFKRTPSFKYVQLGMDYNHFNKKHMDIRILGPYRIVD